MTPRERVLTAFSHKEPDRVPIDFGGIFSGILVGQPYGYYALCEKLGVKEPVDPEVLFFTNAVMNVDERVMRAFDTDIRWVWPGGPSPEPIEGGKYYRDIFGYVLKPDGPYNSIVNEMAPLRHITTVEELKEALRTYPYWPDPTDSRITYLLDKAKYLKENTDYCVAAAVGIGGPIGHMYAWLRGFDYFLIDMHANPEFFDTLAATLRDQMMAMNEAFLGKVGKYLDLVYFSDDVGMQTQEIVSPKNYRRFLKPWHKEFVSEFKRLAPNAKVMFHTCGSVYNIIPDFIEIGVDVLNPVQPYAYMMEPWRLKQEFGKDLSFYGGLDIQQVLPFKSPEEIREEVKMIMSTYGPGGGFLFAVAHEIGPEVKPESVVACFEAAKEYRDPPYGS